MHNGNIEWTHKTNHTPPYDLLGFFVFLSHGKTAIEHLPLHNRLMQSSSKHHPTSHSGSPAVLPDVSIAWAAVCRIRLKKKKTHTGKGASRRLRWSMAWVPQKGPIFQFKNRWGQADSKCHVASVQLCSTGYLAIPTDQLLFTLHQFHLMKGSLTSLFGFNTPGMQFVSTSFNTNV